MPKTRGYQPSEQMNILFVCENYLPHYGGAEVVFKNLAERFVKNDHAVSLITHRLKGTDKKENINNVQVHRVPSLHSRYLFTFSSIPKAIKLAQHHDIIQTTTFNGAFPAWLAGKLTGKPVVLTIHEVWVGKWKTVTDFSWLKSFCHDILERAIYLLPFDHYICVSNATRHDLLQRNIPTEKITTIYNGFDLKEWKTSLPTQKDIAALRHTLELTSQFIYLAWGRPGPSKGFEYLIHAVPKIKETIPNATLLLLLGSIEKYSKKYHELQSLIKTLRLSEKDIKIIPSVPYSQLKTYLAAADCFVIPSLSEGFGYNVLEAAAMKKPIIASNVGSIPEVIQGTHVLIEPKNSAQLAEHIIAVAQKKPLPKSSAKHFSWESSIIEYEQVYQRLIRQGHQGATQNIITKK